MILHIFALTLLWGIIISGTVLTLLIIDSEDCNQYSNGWDKICLDTAEKYKSRALQISPIIGIFFTVVFILIIPKSTSQKFGDVSKK